MPTYIEFPEIAEDLAPKKPLTLLFVGHMSHGSGFSERLEYRLGTDAERTFDVLWQMTDWDNQRAYTALAWQPRSRGRINKRAIALLIEWWTLEKANNGWDCPPFDEVASKAGARLNQKEVWDAELKVWPG